MAHADSESTEAYSNSNNKNNNGSNHKNNMSKLRNNAEEEEVEEEGGDIDFDLDDNLVHLGVRGFFPSGLYLILSFFVFLTPMQYMSSHVSSFTPEHRCKIPDFTLEVDSASITSTSASSAYTSASSASASASASFESLKRYIPTTVIGGEEAFVSCERYETFNHSSSNEPGITK